MKDYNNLFGDSVPLLVAKALNIEISVYEIIHPYVRPTLLNSEATTGINIEVLRTQKHYSALANNFPSKISQAPSAVLGVMNSCQSSVCEVNVNPNFSSDSRVLEESAVTSNAPVLRSVSTTKNIYDFNLKIKLLGQNVRGLGEKKKRDSVLNNLISKGDIIMLQETHSTKKIENDFKMACKGGTVIFSHGTTSTSRGV